MKNKLNQLFVFLLQMLVAFGCCGVVHSAGLTFLGKVSASTFNGLSVRTVADDGQNVFVLVSQFKIPQDCLLNPDGTKACFLELSLVKIDSQGNASKLLLGEFANGSDGALYVEGSNVYAFQNGVSRSSTSAYALDGHLYTVNGASMVVTNEKLIFDNANFGFYPVISPGPVVSHFGFAGYVRASDNRILSPVNPETMMAEYDTAVVVQSKGLVLPTEALAMEANAGKIVQRVVARFNTPVVSPSPSTLPAVAPVQLAQPALPKLGAFIGTRLGAGALHSLALSQDGTLYGWGANTTGELGVGRVVNSAIPLAITAPTGFVKVVAGGSHNLALRSDGSVWSWGDNGYGQLGDASFSRVAPAQIGSGFSDIAAGSGHSLALKRDGTLWAWGDNRCGQLGDSSTTARTLPTQVGTGFVQVAAGDSHSLGIKLDGSLWAWGCNSNGQLGNGTNTRSLSPVLVGNGFALVAARQLQSMAVRTDGTLFAWGWNGSGQLGDGTTVDRWNPVAIGTGFSSVAMGWGHALAVKSVGGSLWAWGRNFGGQLGDGTLANSVVPKQIFSSGFKAVAAGGSHSLGLKTDGTIVSWGYNPDGELGNGAIGVITPGSIGSGYLAIAAGGSHSVAVKSDGSLWSWGDNRYGQLGVGSSGASVYQATPIVISNDYLTMASRRSHSLAVGKPDGVLWSWGVNTEGQLGNGVSGFGEFSSALLNVGSGYVGVAAGDNHSLALDASGGVSAWGYNYYGQLGNGNSGASQDLAVPTAVATGFSSIAAGAHHSVALKPDGSLWVWGSNYFGQLGFAPSGMFSIQSAPRQIGSGYAAVAAGRWHTLALRTDGSLWSWGYNFFGQLGDGSYGPRTDRASPVFVGTGFVAIAAGDYQSLGLRSDGSLWSWGRNSNSQLGNGTQIDHPKPVLIGSGFVAIAGGATHSLAERSDGTVLSWGANSAGQLGDATIASRLTPVLTTNKTSNGPLDLLPEVPNNIPADKIPPYWLQVTKASAVTTAITYNNEDLNKEGSVYVVAYLDPASPLLAGVSAMPRAVKAAAGVAGAAGTTVPAVLTRSGWKQMDSAAPAEALYSGPLVPSISTFSMYDAGKFDQTKDNGLFCVAYAGASANSAKGLIRSVVSGVDANLNQCPPLVVGNSTTLSECFFNWAERSFPQYFAPAAAASATAAPYFYRYYARTGNYLATNSADRHVWALGKDTGGDLLDLGPLSNFSGTAGCQ
jgi:alpha-tubulin suppressor-like RCC1 family protein